MKNASMVVVVACMGLALAPAVAAADHQGFSSSGVPGGADSSSASASYIVQFSPGADRASEVARARALGMTVEFEYANALSGMAVTANAGQLRALQANPNVMLIEADGEVTIDGTQSPATWGLDRTDQRSLPLTNSYAFPSTGAGVTAYILDTGILASHAEFGGRVSGGYTAIADGRGTTDCNGHGTHVAGTVGGATYGMAKEVALVPVRVLDCRGSGAWSGVIAGVDWVAANATKPAVANMSLGGGTSSLLDAAVSGAVEKGVTMVVAAGNSSANACNYSPARTPSAITVGATTSSDARASYSNYGSCLDIFAPGSSITSAWYTGATATNTISGTSMASPHVAGAAALVLADQPSATPAQVTSALVGAGTPNAVTSAGSGSPNLLLFVGSAANPLPTVTSLNPTSGAVGITVTISGTDLAETTSVTFNGVAASFAVTSASSVTATVPAGATSGAVRVTTPAGIAVGPTFTVTETPSISLPSAPLNLSALSVTRTSAVLTWSAPTSGPVDFYEVRLSATSAWTNVGLATSATASNLKRGTAYTWQVRAVNSAGAGPTAQSSFTTLR